MTPSRSTRIRSLCSRLPPPTDPVKIWDVAKGVRLRHAINDPTDAVLTLAFRPGTNDLLPAAPTSACVPGRSATYVGDSIGSTLAHTAGIILD